MKVIKLLDIKLEQILKNPLAIYVYNDINNFHFTTDEIINEDNDDIDKYPEERFLEYDNKSLLNLDKSLIHTFTNTELLDRIGSLDKDLLSTEQKIILSNLYETSHSKVPSKIVEAILNGLQNCESIYIEHSKKNLNFMQELKLDAKDYVDIFKQIEASDFDESRRSYNFEHLGNNLFIFKPDNVKLKGKVLKLKLYIKIDIDASDNKCVYAVSFHKSNDK